MCSVVAGNVVKGSVSVGCGDSSDEFDALNVDPGERDQQDEDSKHVTRLRVIKNRYTGDTGIANSVRYDPLTGRLSEWTDEFEEKDDSDEVPF